MLPAATNGLSTAVTGGPSGFGEQEAKTIAAKARRFALPNEMCMEDKYNTSLCGPRYAKPPRVCLKIAPTLKNSSSRVGLRM